MNQGVANDGVGQPEAGLLSKVIVGAAVAALVFVSAALALALWKARSAGTTPTVSWGAARTAGGQAAAAPPPPVADSAPNAGQDESTQEVLLAAAAGIADAQHGRLLDDPELDAAGSAEAGAEAGGEIPRARRWEIVMADGLTQAAYAEQLDALGIELGVPAPDGKLRYVSQLAAARPTVRQGPAAQEQRLYMTFGAGGLAEADRGLLAKAGIDSADQIVLHFCPAALEQKLADLEQKFANRAAEEIFQTRFAVRPAGDSYEFYVLDQTPRE